MDWGQGGLIVNFLFQPAARLEIPQNDFSDFIIDNDQNGKGHAGKPPVPHQGIHVQGILSFRNVAKGGRQARFKDETYSWKERNGISNKRI